MLLEFLNSPFFSLLFRIVEVLGMFAVLWGFLNKYMKSIVKKMEQDKVQDRKIERLEKSQKELTHGMLCALDGLTQLGANGDVTKGKKRLYDHIIQNEI